MVGRGDNCGSGGEIKTRTECEKAARELGLKWESFRLNSRRYQRYCLKTGQNWSKTGLRVFFNEDGTKAPNRDRYRHRELRIIDIDIRIM